MIGFLFFFFGVMVAIGMCGLAAWTDFKGFRIPNIVSLIIIVSFVIAFSATVLTGQDEIIFMSWKSHLASFVIILLVTMVLFALKVLGAGDSKMMASVALWLGWGGLVPFLFYMAMMGGVLAAVSLALKKYKPLKDAVPPVFAGSWIEKAQSGTNTVPYGIAIAVGTLVSFFFVGYFSPEKWADMMNFSQ